MRVSSEFVDFPHPFCDLRVQVEIVVNERQGKLQLLDRLITRARGKNC